MSVGVLPFWVQRTLTQSIHTGRTYDKQGVTEAIEATQCKMKEVDNVEANLEELKEWLVHAM